LIGEKKKLAAGKIKLAQKPSSSPKGNRRCDKASGKERQMKQNYLNTGAMARRTAEEIVVLDAISQVSARMAKNLFILAADGQKRKGVSNYGKCRCHAATY
jgi:hypothetical protein